MYFKSLINSNESEISQLTYVVFFYVFHEILTTNLLFFYVSPPCNTRLHSTSHAVDMKFNFEIRFNKT